MNSNDWEKTRSSLRKKIVQMICKGKEGHIPSSFSIVDMVYFLYAEILNYRASDPRWEDRDYFILSKGHGCAALYVILHAFGFLKDEDIDRYSQKEGILGGHPDVVNVPGIEASTGSLGHGLPLAAGLALGLKIQNKKNRVFCVVGDGECNEGTIWETALVANRQKLGNLVVMVDLNGSADQILPVTPLKEKWEAFGWQVHEIDGHSLVDLEAVFANLKYDLDEKPKIIIANTIKGKGVSFIEGHGVWHHKIPNLEEQQKIFAELS